MSQPDRNEELKRAFDALLNTSTSLKDGFELISFYLYDRINPDGTINYLLDENQNEVKLETAEDLFNLLCKVNPSLFE